MSSRAQTTRRCASAAGVGAAVAAAAGAPARRSAARSSAPRRTRGRRVRERAEPREPRAAAADARERRREEPRPPRARGRQVRRDGVELRREAEVDHAVGLVDDERLQAPRVEAGRLLEVLERAAGRRHEEARADDARLLRRPVARATAGDQARREVVPRADDAQHPEDLQRELARRRDDERAQAVLARPPLAVQRLDGRDQERQRLPRTRAGRAEHVAVRERVRDRRALDRLERLEAAGREARERPRRQRQRREAHGGVVGRAPAAARRRLGNAAAERRDLGRRLGQRRARHLLLSSSPGVYIAFFFGFALTYRI